MFREALDMGVDFFIFFIFCLIIGGGVVIGAIIIYSKLAGLIIDAIRNPTENDYDGPGSDYGLSDWYRDQPSHGDRRSGGIFSASKVYDANDREWIWESDFEDKYDN